MIGFSVRKVQARAKELERRGGGGSVCLPTTPSDGGGDGDRKATSHCVQLLKGERKKGLKKSFGLVPFW